MPPPPDTPAKEGDFIFRGEVDSLASYTKLNFLLIHHGMVN